ncbi:MAG: EAL domain-containing protein, partial [Gammaproteobacteria bacterium]
MKQFIRRSAVRSWTRPGVRPGVRPVLRWRKLVSANLWFCAGYVAAGWLGYLLTPEYGLLSPLDPAIALGVAVLTSFGWRLLPGLVAGAAIVADPSLFPTWAANGSAPLLTSLLLAGAAVLHALLTAVLLRRHVDPALAGGGDVLRFMLLVPLASCVRPSVGVPLLALYGSQPAGPPLLMWLAWWAADTTAVLLVAPLCWVACARPRNLWRRRRLNVALPLAVASAAFLVIHHLTLRWDQDQQLQAFRLQAQEVSQLLQDALHEHERFLSGVASALGAGGISSPGQFTDVAHGYLRQRPELLAMGWLPRVPGAERARFEREASMWLQRPYQIVDVAERPGGPLVETPSAPRAQYYPVLMVEPGYDRLVAGGDFLSEPRRAATVTEAIRTRAPTASAPVVLRRTGRSGIHLLQAVGAGPGPPRGLLLLALRAETYVNQTVRASHAAILGLELDDVSAGARPARVVDTIPEGYHPPDYQRQLNFGGRTYHLRLAPSPAYLASHTTWQSWSVLLGGLLLAALMGALLLVLSGERAKVQAQVKEATVRLREREGRLQAILDHAGDAIVTTDAHGRLLAANRAAARMFRLPVAEMPGMAIGQLLALPEADPAAALARLAGAELSERELTGSTGSGVRFPLLVSVSPVGQDGTTIYVCIMHDLTEQRRAQDHIHQLAHQDVLTGLENRLSLTEHLEQLLAQARRAHASVALLFLDLDRFKKINDSHGHHAGDLLLVEVARRLRELLRDVDIIARLGGDEFIVAMSGQLTPDLVSAVAVRIVQALGQPYHLDGKVMHSGTSVGIAMFPADADSSATLLRHADLAMYEAKTVGRGNFQFFSPAMNAATHERLAMEQRLRHALGHAEFELYLQPQVQLTTGRIVGAEALLRWHQPELGLIMPSRLIPVAEESGLILPVGDWVMDEAVRLLASWREEGMEALRLAINLSARQCHGRELLPRLDALLADQRVQASCLEVEITESAAMHDPESTRALLRQLRTRGIQVAIDDFGTGYSSLNYLKLFAIDRIKIDRAFVTDIESDPNDAAIVSATIGLAHSLGLAVIAEGVETPAQSRFLHAKLCDEAQGNLFGEPMTAQQFIEVVRAGALAVLAVRTLPAGRRPGVVVTLHNLPVGGRAVRAVSAVLERVVARGADAVLGVSGDLVDRARRLGAAHAERALVPAPPHRAAA